MATLAPKAAVRRRPRPIAPDVFERVLALLSILLTAAVLAALARGYGQWAVIPRLVWAHLVTILVALGLTPVLLLGRRGTRRHRWLGRMWVAAMFLTAALSFGVRQSSGTFSPIHILSVAVVVLAPWAWWTARTHRIEAHRGTVRGMIIGALLVAGFFTFPFNRLLGTWLFG